MSPITHLFAGWVVAERWGSDARARCLIAWAGVAPDLDGLGVVVDLANRALGRPDSDWFGAWHHVLFHGAFGAGLMVALAWMLGVKRASDLGCVFLSFHLHLLCDFFGSRGPVPADIWPIHYLAPFTKAWTVSFAHQWALNAWPNMLFTILLIAWSLYRAVQAGLSPVSVIHPGWDVMVVEALRARLKPGSLSK